MMLFRGLPQRWGRALNVEDNRWLISPVEGIAGELSVPGDKSISHRVAMLASLADGRSRVTGFLRSEDCLNTLSAVESLGAEVIWEGDDLFIDGCGGLWKDNAASLLDLGNSGTGMRLIAGLIAGHDLTVTLTGDSSLSSRPMGRIAAPLQEMGANIESAPGVCAPLTIKGGRLSGIHYCLPVASAQVKSCVLLAGLLASGKTCVVEPLETRDHTERLLIYMGVTLRIDGRSIEVEGSDGSALHLEASEFAIPGDFSSAAFWLAAAACRRGGEVTVRSLGVNPRRIAFLDLLRRMGADVTVGRVMGYDWEPRADVTVKGRGLHATDVGGGEIPNLIDELPLVAVLGAFAEGETVISNAEELRVKESDRITVMADALIAAGVDVTERPDGMVIRGGRVQGGCVVKSQGDHRIAMAMAILGLGADAPVDIRGTSCVATSYPGFIDDLKKVVTI